MIACAAVSAQETTLAEQSENQLGPSQMKLSDLSERFEIGEELIVTVRVGQLNYGEVFTIVTATGLFVNVEDLIGLLDFPINRIASEEAYLLQGWFISEAKTFEMRLFDRINEQGIGEVVISGKTFLIPASQYMEMGSQKLLNFDVVGSWFGLSLDFDSQNLAVNVTASTPLPAQSRLAREKRKTNDKGHNKPEHPNYDFGYFARSHQMFDARINSSYRNDQISTFYTVVGVQDVAGFSSRFFFNGNDDDIFRSANLNMKRQSVDADLLGFLKATTIEFGDIRPSRVGNRTGGQNLGITINNQKLGQLYNFDVTNITGVIPEGWDVELYQNGVLIEKTIGTQGGQYEFIDVPLFAQLNIFDVVKYGPQGQVQKERFERNVDASLFDKTPNYNISVTRSNSSLFPDPQQVNGLQDWLLSGNYSYSFSDWFSGDFGHSINLDNSDAQDQYFVGANARLSPRLLTGATFSFIDTENLGLGVSVRSRLFDQYFTLNLNTNKNNGLTNTSAILRMNGAIYSGAYGRLAYSNEFSGRWEDSQNYSHVLNNTLTFNNRLGYVSHNFSKQIDKDEFEYRTLTTGGLTLGGTRGMVNLRLGAFYDFGEDDDNLSWTNLEASINYRVMDNISSQASYSRSFLDDSDSFSLGVDWRQPSYALNAKINHSSNGNTDFSLSARFSMSETPFGEGYVASDRGFTSSALVAVRVFEDVNQNFIFDVGDRPIPNVTVKAAQVSRRGVTGKEGVAILEGVASFLQTDLDVDIDSLDDPYLMQSTISTSLTPRAGLLTLVNYPFVQGIEFEGEVSSIDIDGKLSALANAPIEIINSRGDLAKIVKSDFDGYFYSGILFPDKYTIKLSQNYLQRSELEEYEKVQIDASSAGDLITDISITVKKQLKQDGFQVYLASFTTERAAKVLLHMYRINHRGKSIVDNLHIFYSLTDKRYYLNAGLFSKKENAENFCLSEPLLRQRCQIRQDRFESLGY